MSAKSGRSEAVEAPTSERGQSNERLRKSLRQFVRTKGEKYLLNENVTSIGVGYKIVNGVPTDQLAIQFTVGRKAADAEALVEMDTAPLPESIEVDGLIVPTDVLERRYRPAFKVIDEVDADPRKMRSDPISPGLSVANANSSAGTIGAIVYDVTNGAPYVLSNWHVLHGPDGHLGDTVVQPGPYDDNRTSRNRLGRLVRSHLGEAGDCAVSSVEDRGLDAEVFALGVAPKELGDPDLGDTVMKSGRTTGVTYGVVSRVDVLTPINYGGTTGVRNIGGFEIGPDPNNPAPGGEISQPGDSGSLWVFTDEGVPQPIVAGLHFGGETPDSPDEYALACLPRSVFKKLEISLVAPAAEQIETAAGYDKDFLGERVDVPRPHRKIAQDNAKTVDRDTVVDHTHFSLQMSKKRRLARWVAWNIDGSSLKKLSRRGIDFNFDPQLDPALQVGDQLYRDNDLDRGHIARRADLLWGPTPEATRANEDSFYFSNITPQMNDFNQSVRRGVWGELEDAIFADVEVDDLRVSAFGGPVFQDDDRVYRTVALPREYWKVIAYRDGGELKARAFLLTQNLHQIESLELDEFRVHQVSLKELEERTNLQFPERLLLADSKTIPESLNDQPLSSSADIRW